MLDGWGKPDTVGGPRVQRHGRRGRRRGGSVAGRRPGGRRPLPALWDAAGGASKGKPSQCEQRGAIVVSHVGGRLRPLRAARRRCASCAVPDGMDPRVAALAEPLAVALHGITRAGLGAGGLGHGLRRGPDRRAEHRRAGGTGDRTGAGGRARPRAGAPWPAPSGAHEVLEPDDLETYPAWEPERLSPRAVDAVLECSGKQAAMEAGLHQLRRGGRLVLVGAGIEAPSLRPQPDAPQRARRVRLVRLRRRRLRAGHGHAGVGGDPDRVLVEPVDVGLDGLADALAGLASGAVAGKVMVVPEVRRAGRDGPPATTRRATPV